MTRLLSTLVLAAVVFLTTSSGLSADPPTAKNGKPVPPLSELIQTLKDPDRMKQEEAAQTILEHYKGNALEALPAAMESLGHELNRHAANPKGRACLLHQVIPKLAAEAGPERVKPVFEATRHKDKFVRAAAFCLLFYAAEDKKAGVDRTELLDAIRRGVKDDTPLVRAQAAMALRLYATADQPTVDQAVAMLGDLLDDRTAMDNMLHGPAFQAAGALHLYKGKAKPAVKALIRAATDARSDARTVRECCLDLGLMAKEDEKVAAEVIAGFRPLVTDPKRASGNRSEALWGMSAMGPAAEKLVPDVTAILKDKSTPPSVCWAACQVIVAVGPPAKSAVPALVSRLERSENQDEQFGILGALSSIGPAASEASEAVAKWMAGVQNRQLRMSAEHTLSKIK